MDEFSLIARYLRPLAVEAGALRLADDAAIIPGPDDQDWVITKDAIVEGVHFPRGEDYALVARRLARVNLSDLAAKGAEPYAYLLACIWPDAARESDIAAFADGLAADQAEFGWSLLGGDTTRGEGPAAFSLTAIGRVRRGAMVGRAGAKPGDLLFLTGTVGDSGLGCRLALGQSLALSPAEEEYLIARYRLPQPRCKFSAAAQGLPSAALDVSDGLLADAGHLALASGVGLEIECPALPLSSAAAAWVAQGGRAEALAAAGDDYEILLAAPPERAPGLAAAAAASGTALTRIGRVVAGAGGVRLLDGTGREIAVAERGYRHF